jgi:hypothetical protein
MQKPSGGGREGGREGGRSRGGREEGMAGLRFRGRDGSQAFERRSTYQLIPKACTAEGKFVLWRLFPPSLLPLSPVLIEDEERVYHHETRQTFWSQSLLFVSFDIEVLR